MSSLSLLLSIIIYAILNITIIFSYNQRMHKNLLFKSSRYINKSNQFKSLLFSTSSKASVDTDVTKDNNNVRVITYNVLSSSLAEPDYFFT